MRGEEEEVRFCGFRIVSRGRIRFWGAQSYRGRRGRAEREEVRFCGFRFVSFGRVGLGEHKAIEDGADARREEEVRFCGFRIVSLGRVGFGERKAIEDGAGARREEEVRFCGFRFVSRGRVGFGERNTIEDGADARREERCRFTGFRSVSRGRPEFGSGTANTPPVTTDNTFNLTLTGQESGAAVAYQASLNGGAFAATTASQSGLADGDYQFRALVTDAAGNTSTSNVIEVVVDNSVPAAGTLSFSNLTDSGTANTPPVTTDNTFNLTLTGQESGAAVAYQASLNGGAFAATTASQSGLADGDYQFRALVTDAAGNTSTSNVIEVVVDNSVPAEALAITAITTDTGTAGDFITSDTTLIVSGSNGALAAGEKIQISSDGTNWFDVTPIDSTHWSYDDTATPHTSSFTYQARILDTAGNIGTTASQAITIDTTAPTITGDLGITVNNGSSVVLTTADFHAVDLDNPASQLTFSVTNPTHGYVAFVSAPGAPITSFTEADLEAGSVIFVHDGSATTEATFKVSVSDGALTSAPTTILASVPTVSIVVKTANGMNFQNEDTISALGAGVLQPGGTAHYIYARKCCSKPRFRLPGDRLHMDRKHSDRGHDLGHPRTGARYANTACGFYRSH